MFEHLLGPSMLTKNNTLESTSTLLNDKEFVLLYFSASWCGPCRQFTPQLKQFYNYVNSNGQKVEIVFVSFDRNSRAFYDYYSTMPWLSIPLQSSTTFSSSSKKNFISHLSSLFWVNAIPTLVVMTKDELYVTNAAKSQISNVISTRGDPDMVLESWRDAQHVPIDEAYLGIIPSIYSSFKNAYNYIMGNESSNASNTTSENAGSKNGVETQNNDHHTKLIPSRLLVSFFEKIVRKLDVYPNIDVCEKLLVRYENEGRKIDNGAESFLTDNDDGGRRNVPISLESQRILLLNEQMQALKEAVSEYNSSLTSCTDDGTCYIDGAKGVTVSVEEVQGCLKFLGCEDFTMIDSDNKTHAEILKLMKIMNNSARMAFVRSVLWSEVSWAKQYEKADDKEESNRIGDNSKDCEAIFPGKYSFIDFSQVYRTLQRKGDGSKSLKEIQMDRATILEYCGLFNTAISLPEVQSYLLSGRLQLDAYSNTKQNIYFSSRTPEQRIVNIQSMMLCAVGYDPVWGGKKLHDQIIKIQEKDNANHDEELNKVVSAYIKDIHNNCGKNAA